MVIRLSSCAYILGVSIISTAVGCGSSSSNSNDGGPSSGDDGGLGGGGDGSMGSGDSGNKMDAAPVPCGAPDGGVNPMGMPIVKSGVQQVTPDGVTSDGYIVFTDTNNIQTVPLAGGTPATVAADDGSGNLIVGKVVLVWTGAGNGGGGGGGGNTAAKLTAWTSATGAKTIATATQAGGFGAGATTAVSSDGKYIAYFDNSNGTTADLYAAGVDGSGATKLVAGVNLNSNSCSPQVGFAGDAVVASYCVAAATPDGGTVAEAGATEAGAGEGGTAEGGTGTTDAGGGGTNPATATIQSWSGTGWATTGTASANAYPTWTTDGKTYVAYRNSAGFYVYNVSMDSSTLIDATGTTGTFTPDGSTLLYVSTDGSIKSTPVGTAPTTATVLAAASYTGINSLSPNGKYMLSYKTMTRQTSDLYLSGTASGSTAATIAMSGAIAGNGFGDPFSADSSHALFFTNISGNAGDYNAQASTGTTPVKLASAVWIAFATTGAKTIYDDNYNAGTGAGNGQADLKVVDTSAATPAPTTIVSKIDPNFYLTADKTKVVYAWNYCQNDVRDGIYVTTLP